MGGIEKTANLLSQSAFAKLCKVSAEAIRKACAAGKINIVGEGRNKKIDLDGLNTISYLHDKNSQRNKPKIKETVVSPHNVENSARKIDDDSRSGSVGNVVNLIDDDTDYRDISASDIKKLKDLESAKRSAQERMKIRGELIDRKLVRIVLGRIYTIEVNEIKVIADKAPPKIAALFEDESPEKILAVSQLLSSDFAKCFEHIKHVVDKFITDIDDPKGITHYVS